MKIMAAHLKFIAIIKENMMKPKLITKASDFTAPAGTTADSIDWGKYPEGPLQPFGMNGMFTGQTDVQNSTFRITTPLRRLARHKQDDGSSQFGWNGRFDRATQESILFTDFFSGPIFIEFDMPVRGLSFQLDFLDVIDQSRLGVTVFYVGSNTPEVLARAGTPSSNAGDGSADWLGALTSNPKDQIHRVTISVTVLDKNYQGTASFAINKLNLFV
jgi:hypothetical protein